ncbi:MAG: hypothetical protein ACI4I1_11045 [Oscillospiraceae bacterium]
MKLDEFCKKTAKSSLVEPDAIKIIMEKLLEMPLSEMYSTALNRRTKNGYANDYVLESAELQENGDASKSKLKHFLNQIIEMHDDNSKKEQYEACCLMLAAWNCGFVPMNYERKKE